MISAADNSYCSQPRFQLYTCGSEDLLDVLARAVSMPKWKTPEEQSSSESIADLSCPSDPSHKRELALRCRNELSQLHRQGGCAIESQEKKRRRCVVESVDQKLASPRYAQGSSTVEVDKVEEMLMCKEHEVSILRRQLQELEQVNRDILLANDEKRADLEVASVEMWSQRQKVEQLEDSLSDALREKASNEKKLHEVMEML